jgi:ubiquinone/menaquinone biosynthesis C-methylase UbiE
LDSILDDFYARYHHAFLHAKGELATNQLLDILSVEAQDVILEFGCGSGATLVKIGSQCRFEELLAVDTSPIMVRRAQQRISLTGLSKRIRVQQLVGSTLPFVDERFNKIYVESVSGVQSDDQLKGSQEELYRVVEFDGTLVFNEMIWTKK